MNSAVQIDATVLVKSYKSYNNVHQKAYYYLHIEPYKVYEPLKLRCSPKWRGGGE
jgi:hypothetical protein